MLTECLSPCLLGLRRLQQGGLGSNDGRLQEASALYGL